MGEFQKAVPNEWGWVDTGREVTDTTTGVVYCVDNQVGSVTLRSREGQSMRFEAFDRIDHKRFQFRE